MVDDFVFHKRVEWPEACGGLAAGCPVCGHSLSAELCGVIEQYAPVGCPLWPLPASSACVALLRGEAPAFYCAVTWDASKFGWAALARWWDLSGPAPVARELLLVGS